jgi:outer membrane lipoprotein-sorting protein
MILLSTAAFYVALVYAPVRAPASPQGERHLVLAANVTGPAAASSTPAAPSAPASPAPAAAPAGPPASPTVPAADAKLDAKLDAVVDAVQRTYDGTRDFKGAFTQRFTYTMLRRTQESTGVVTFAKPGRMRWDYAAPAAKSFIVDGKALWLVQPADKVAFVNACFQQDGLTASVAFLFGQGRLREQFTISWFDGVFGDKADHHLLLVPKDNNGVFARLILVVDPKTSRVKQSVVVDPAGNVNQFVFTKLEFNVGAAGGVDDKVFTYKPLAGVQPQRMPGSCDAPVAGLK